MTDRWIMETLAYIEAKSDLFSQGDIHLLLKILDEKGIVAFTRRMLILLKVKAASKKYNKYLKDLDSLDEFTPMVLEFLERPKSMKAISLHISKPLNETRKIVQDLLSISYVERFDKKFLYKTSINATEELGSTPERKKKNAS